MIVLQQVIMKLLVWRESSINVREHTIAYGGGALFSGEDEASGAGMQKPSSVKKTPKTKKSTNAK